MRLFNAFTVLSALFVLTQAYIPLLPYTERISKSAVSLSGFFKEKPPLERWWEKAQSVGSRGGEVVLKKVMDKVRVAYIHASVTAGIPREQAEDQSNSVLPKVTHALLIAGNMIDEHPILLEAITFALAMLILPEIQILRPIMSIFGIGPLGPIKGSSAAWCQRLFFGGMVPEGSWFAILQKVGMTLAGSWLQKVAASLALSSLLGFAVTKCSL